MVETIEDSAFRVNEFKLEIVMVPPASVLYSVLVPVNCGTLSVDTIMVEPRSDE
jgi:hypothetical protein